MVITVLYHFYLDICSWCRWYNCIWSSNSEHLCTRALHQQRYKCNTKVC